MTSEPNVNQESKKCKYDRSCHEQINEGHHESLCIFHCPSDKKGVSERRYESLIDERISSGNLHFQGFVFPWSISFSTYEHFKNPNFSFCKFEGLVDFSGITIDSPYFNGAKFLKGGIFKNCRFTGKNVEFNNNYFFNSVTFEHAIFECEKVFFNKVRARGEIFIFHNATVNGALILRDVLLDIKSEISFTKANIGSLTMYNCRIFSRSIPFVETVFHRGISLIDVKFIKGRPYFQKIKFNGSTSFNNVDFGLHPFLCTLTLLLGAVRRTS